jgi:putative oxidoreductase
MMKNLLFGGPGGASRVADAGLLVLRVGIGLYLSLAHGLGKMPPPEMLVRGVEAMGFPAPVVFAWLAGLSEFAGGLLVALGLLTRPAALMILFTMGVAAFRVHLNDPWTPSASGGASKEMAMLYLVPALALLLTGAGRFSIDRVIRGK